MKEVAETKRINIKISAENNEYLDAKSRRSGISKSALAAMMIDTQINQEKTIRALDGYSDVLKK